MLSIWKPVESAVLVVPLMGKLKIDPAMDGRDALGGADIGAPRVFRLSELDRNWRPSSATWKTRDSS